MPLTRTRARAPHRKLLPSQGRQRMRRLEIEVPETDVQALQRVAELTGETTLTAILRDALKAYAWLVIEQGRNRAIISEDRVSGVRTELMPLLRVSAL